jgi:hypothetical protein
LHVLEQVDFAGPVRQTWNVEVSFRRSGLSLGLFGCSIFYINVDARCAGVDDERCCVPSVVSKGSVYGEEVVECLVTLFNSVPSICSYHRPSFLRGQLHLSEASSQRVGSGGMFLVTLPLVVAAATEMVADAVSPAVLGGRGTCRTCEPRVGVAAVGVPVCGEGCFGGCKLDPQSLMVVACVLLRSVRFAI